MGGLLAANTHLAWLQGLEGIEGDTQALGSHGGGSRLQILVPGDGRGKEREGAKMGERKRKEKRRGEKTGKIEWT